MVGTATSGLASETTARSAFGAAEDVAALLDRVASPGRVEPGDHAPSNVLLVDDLDLLDDLALVHLWDRVARSPHLRIVAAIDVAAMTGFTSNPVAGLLKRSRQMLVLRPDDPGQFLQLTGTRLDIRPGVPLVPGRGVLLADRVARVVQVALPGDTVRRTPVRSRDTVSGVTVTTTQSLRTAAIATPAPR